MSGSYNEENYIKDLESKIDKLTDDIAPYKLDSIALNESKIQSFGEPFDDCELTEISEEVVAGYRRDIEVYRVEIERAKKRR